MRNLSQLQTILRRLGNVELTFVLLETVRSIFLNLLFLDKYAVIWLIQPRTSARLFLGTVGRCSRTASSGPLTARLVSLEGFRKGTRSTNLYLALAAFLYLD
jgi:hypothetical protein